MPNEQAKPPQGLNLGAKAAQVDQNSAPKPANPEQTEVKAPDNGSESSTGDAAIAKAIQGGETQTQQGERISTNELNDEMSAQYAVENSGVSGSEDGVTIYSSHPIQNFKLGRFQFTNSVYRASPEDAAELDKLLDSPKLAPVDKAVVKKLDLNRVDAIVEARRQASKTFDSSMGREALAKLHQDNPTIGVQDIAHAARPQADHNVPLIPNEPVDPEGETGVDQGPHTPPSE